MKELNFLLLNLPNPLLKNIYRGFAGGFGTIGGISSNTLLPVYLIYAASALEKSGCHYEIIDAQVKGYNLDELKKEVRRVDPDVIMSWVSLPSIYHDTSCLKELKRMLTDTLVVTWGTVSNIMYKEILSSGAADLIIKGDYPYFNAISEFAEQIKFQNLKKIPGATFIQNGQIFSNPTLEERASLDRLSLDVYFRLPIKNYLDFFEDLDGSEIGCLPIVTSAGCPHGCIYCPYPIGYGKQVSYKSVEKIIEEIEFLINNFGIEGFGFRDQLFTQNKARLSDICNRIIDKGYKVKWLTEARADQVSRETLELMNRAGCFRLHFGVETGSPKLLEIGKPGLNAEKFSNAFQVCKDLGIFTIAHVIIGLPGEDEKTIKDTVDFLRYLNPDKVNVNIITPYPGTKLFEMATERGWILTTDWSEYTSYNPVMRTDNLTPEQLKELQKYVRKNFRNYKLIHDSRFRGRYVKSIPRKINDRLSIFLEKRI